MEEIIELLQKEITKVTPNVTLGDDDSVYLDEFQEGYIAGLIKAISFIKTSRSKR